MHTYGYIPDKEDHRDYKYRDLDRKVILPKQVDLRNQCSSIRDQGDLGACTAFAITSGLREMELIAHNKEYKELSPLFLYYNERDALGTINEDSGAGIRDGLKTLAKQGVCPESNWPYDIKKFTFKPGEEAFNSALQYKSISYHRLENVLDVKECVALGNGVVMGIMLYPEFESDIVANTGRVPMPKFLEKPIGGHAAFCVGYKDDKRFAGHGYFIVRNSWGTTWGDNGYFYLPYAYINSTRVPDMWTVVCEE